MKKLIIALALTLSCIAFSQSKEENNLNKEKKSPEERVEKQLKKMTTDLSLDQKQAANLKEILLNQSKKREEKVAAHKANTQDGQKISKEEKQALMLEIKQNQDELKGKMKEILNPDQFAKWEKNKEDKRQKMIEKLKEHRKDK